MHDLAVTAVQTQVRSQFLLQPCCLLSTVAWPPWSSGPVRWSAPSGVRSCGCFGETSPAHGLTLFRMVSCRAGWGRFWTWPKNSARLRFSAAPRACDTFKIVFAMYRGESRCMPPITNPAFQEPGNAIAFGQSHGWHPASSTVLAPLVQWGQCSKPPLGSGDDVYEQYMFWFYYVSAFQLASFPRLWCWEKLPETVITRSRTWSSCYML